MILELELGEAAMGGTRASEDGTPAWAVGEGGKTLASVVVAEDGKLLGEAGGGGGGRGPGGGGAVWGGGGGVGGSVRARGGGVSPGV